MKTIKAIIKLLNGYPLEPGEQRRIDALWFEIKCASLTILIVIFIIWFLSLCGVFIGDYKGD
mgnify:CR=1 FL=1